MELTVPYDESYAQTLLGKYVLIGLRYCTPTGEVEKQTQIHGIIIKTEATQGVLVELKGKRDGEHFWLPPDLRAFQEADEGEYRLFNTGEVVVNPDLKCSWTVNPPPSLIVPVS